MKEELKEILTLLRKLRFRDLLLTPTDNSLLQVGRYLIVGGFSFIADAAVLRLFENVFGFHYLVAAAAGFLFGVTVNYVLSGLLAFAGKKARVSKTAELVIFLAISVAGLGLTELLMWLFTDIGGLHYMLSKVIAAAIVFFWNFLAKKVLYRQ